MADQSFEKELLNHLKFSGLKGDHLQELVRSVVAIKDLGLQGISVFPKGIPAIDRLGVRTILTGAQVEAFFKHRVIDMPRVGPVSVLSHGIPNPEIFSMEFEVA
jgi:hypothetical protein